MHKEDWPDSRLSNWLKDPSLSSLRDLASHLHDKTEGRGRLSGFKGTGSDVENQINAHLSALEQEVFVLEDVVQVLLQIIGMQHERKFSQRAKRTLGWIWKKIEHYTDWLGENRGYKIIAILTTLASVVFYLLRFWKR